MKSYVSIILMVCFMMMAYATSTPEVTTTVVSEPTEVSEESIFLSCEIDDFDCKSGMADQCFDAATECYEVSNGNIDPCVEILKTCERIWNY